MKYFRTLLSIVCFCFGCSAMATDYYVNPAGNDLWSGTKKKPDAKKNNGPFKTLERAKQAIRTLKSTNKFTDDVTVNIASGSYYLKTPLAFNLLDSGLPGKEIVWKGERDGQVIISGGLPITCEQRDDTFWDCPVTTLPVSTLYFDGWRTKGNGPKFELFVNDQKLELARWPDKDWAHIKLPLDKNTQFSVMETLPDLTGDNSNAQVHIFAGNDWYDQYIGISSVDGLNNAIELSATTQYPLASGRRFYIQNLASLLNAPGEWFYESTTQIVSFIAPTGLAPTEVMLSSLPNILVADFLSNVTFKNISFQHSTGTAITIRNSTNLVLDNLDVNNVGGKGVAIAGGQNVQLSNSNIHHTGAHAVTVSGGNSTTLKSSGHVVHNNHIHHMGTTILTNSSGIEANGVGITITHNLLEQGAGTAILFTGNDNLIDKNEIHHFCLQASDCGAIYAGRNWSWRGNVISNNYLHDIIGYGMTSLDLAKNKVVYQSPDGARGVYLDDGMSGVEVSGNIFENVGFIAVHIGGGRDNKITNNYFNTSGFIILIDNRDSSRNQTTLDASAYNTAIWQQKYPELALPMLNKTLPEGNSIERNIMVATNPIGRSLGYHIPINSTTISDNLIWPATGKFETDYNLLELKKLVRAATWSQWGAERIEKGSIIADPCVSIVDKQMINCSGSPVNTIGFTPLATDMGLLP